MQIPARIVICATLLSFGVWGQTPRQRDPELKRLDYFTGNWSTSGNMLPGPMGPGGSVTSNEHNLWQDGHYYLIGRSEFTSPIGKGNELSVMGYDPGRKVFTYESFSSDGEHEVATGTMDDTTWTWTSDEPNAPFKWRYVQKIQSPKNFHSSFEISQDGGHWTTVLESTSTKQ